MLRSIELSGFKSFADSTRMEFSDGISALVGPNGSGKSNIVDAIKWVLGEQSMKKLRGNEMTDVIFNGSGTRQAVNAAEVTLTFENKDNLFGLDTKEVHFTRRIYRSGESEYLVNRQASRLKDFRELLSGTGLGSQAYSIIEQGRVEGLLQSTSVQRRAVFEEAAGIARFNAKKQETLRRLERTRQNLFRVSDIVKELENQLRNTKSQAGKAQLYRQYDSRLRELRTESSLILWTRNKVRIDQVQAELQESEACEKDLEEKIAQNENDLSESNRILDSLENRFRKVENELASIREQMATDASTISFQFTQIGRLEKEIPQQGRKLLELNGKNDDTEGQMNQVALEISQAQKHLRDVSDTFDASLQKKQEKGAECARMREEISTFQHDLQALDLESSRLLGEIKVLNSRISKLENSGKERRKKIAELLKKRQKIAEENGMIKETDADLIRKKDQLRTKIDVLKKVKKDLNGSLEKKKQEYSDLKLRQIALKERISLLQELLRKQDGISPGVREVLKNMDNPESPFRFAYGLVAALIRVNEVAAPLIELALGASAQYIVVAPEPELFRYIEENSSKFAGRVGFLWLDNSSRDSDRGRRTTYEGVPGVLGRADQYVETEPRFRSLARRLLGRTWIVETLAVAKNLYRESDGRTNFLTFSGEYLSADGSLIVGPDHEASGLISRRSELRALSERLAETEEKIESMEKETEEFREEIAQKETELAQMEETFGTYNAQAEEIRLQQRSVSEREQAVQESVRQLEEEIRGIEAESEQLALELQSNRDQKQQNEQKKSEQAAAFAILKKDYSEASAVYEKILKDNAAQEVERAKSEERLEFLTDRKKQYEESRIERKNLLKDQYNRLISLKAQKEEAELIILSRESEQALLYGEKERISFESEDVFRERKRLNAKKNKIQADLRKLAQEQSGNQEKKHQKELEIERILQEQRTLVARMKEDYGITLDEDFVQLQYQKRRRIMQEAAESGNSAAKEPTNAARTSVENPAVDPAAVSAEESEDLLSPENEYTEEEENALIEDYRKEIEELKKKLQKLGNVNLEAIETLESLESRYTTYFNQYTDMMSAERSIMKVIERVNQDSKKLFMETFDAVKIYFCDIFRKFFGGGHADLVLEDPEHPLECGIEIAVCPPGKELKSVSLLSGGEKTLTCVALLLAIFRYRTTPVCILDEVDAALDEGNVGRFAKVLQDFQTETQFLIITHSKKTMTSAKSMYGVTMQDSGVSKLLSVQFDQVGDNGEILLRKGSPQKTAEDKVA
ncbi:MAG: chromosome segregation protein SMC [Planctomycetia bacterium]|nr:chromosome segregation protein SMC [Planctomycetia bacterium]